MFYLKLTIGIFIAFLVTRLFPHPPNFTSVIALSFYVPLIFGFMSIPIVLLSFVISDLFIGFHNVLFFTWGSVIFNWIIFKIFYLFKFNIKNIWRNIRCFNIFYNFKLWCLAFGQVWLYLFWFN